MNETWSDFDLRLLIEHPGYLGLVPGTAEYQHRVELFIRWVRTPYADQAVLRERWEQLED